MVAVYFVVMVGVSLAAAMTDRINWVMIAAIILGSFSKRPYISATCIVILFTTFHVAAMQELWARAGIQLVGQTWHTLWIKTVIGAAALWCGLLLNRLRQRSATAPSA